MNHYINVKFGLSNKTYYFATDILTLKVGDFVVVDTVVGLELAEVVTTPELISTLNYDKEIKPILRIATRSDLRTYEDNEKLANMAIEYFEANVKQLNLDMRLIGAQYTLDRAKILFTYVADDRIDFRELLKLLAGQLHCRIELKQVNSRERAQLVGGLGVCGLPLCCTTFLTQFEGVSLSKAKNQMLSINIPKLSGQCGKLMCCLKYEDDLYTEAKKDYPAINTKLVYDGREYKVTGYNILSKMVKISNEEDIEYLPLDEIKSIIFGKRPNKKKETFINDHSIYENKKDGSNKSALQNSKKEEDKADVKKHSSPNQNKKHDRKSVKEEPKEAKQRHSNKEELPKKPAKVKKNIPVDNPSTQNTMLFAGQANKVQSYQDNYNKNFNSEKPHHDHNKKHKPKQQKNTKDKEAK